MVDNSEQVAEELEQWAKKMGFVPGPDTSKEMFQKLCRGSTLSMWRDVMRQVRPKEETLHIQKNLLLQRLRSGKPLDKDPVQGHLGQQVLLASQLAAKEKKRNALLESLQKRELSIKNKEKALRKSGHKAIEQENQIDEFKKKQLLFKIKSKESRSKLIWFKEIAAVASDLCPPSPNAKPRSAKDLDSAETAVTKCVDAIQDFHAKSRETDIDVVDGSESGKALLRDLWQQIRLDTGGWGAQQIWNAVNSKLMAELMEEISALCTDDSKTESRAIQSWESSNGNASSLPAQHVTSVVEWISLNTKAQIESKALIKIQEDLLTSAGAEVSKLNASQLNKSMNTSEMIKTWIEAHSKKAVLSSKLQGIKAELSKLKETMPCRSSAFSSLKCTKEELARLDVQVANDKKQIEENIFLLRTVASKLRSARSKALAQRASFNSLPSFLRVSRQSSFDSEAGSFSPQMKGPLSSTMIGNVTADSNLSFNTTCDSIADKCCEQSNVSEVLTTLRESISKEAKLFIKVHLETVPFVVRNGRRESLCNLMVQGPLMTSHASNMPLRNFLQIVRGTPFSSTPCILMKQLHSQTHVRALHMYKVMNEIPSPIALQAQVNLEALRKSSAKHEINLQEKIDAVDASVAGIKLLLSKGQDNLKTWLERPLQTAVPCNLVVNGLKFHEWCERYDEA